MRTTLRLPLVLLACATWASALDVPYLAGRVNDTAGMIPDDARARIETTLADLEKRTGAQVAVLTIPTLDGENLEDFSMKVASTWKLGRKGQDDGVLLLIARDDRKMRLEVGYGLESRLTDATCGRILDNIVRPEFRAGHFGAGVEKAVDAIAGTIDGKDVVPATAPGPSNDLANIPWPARLMGLTIFIIVVGTFSFVALFGKGCQGWFLYLFLLPFWGTFPAAFVHPKAVLFTIPAWLIGFPILKWLLHSTPAGKTWLKGHPGLVTFATSTAHSGSGGGGGFSGGGGSFGGGGASSSW